MIMALNATFNNISVISWPVRCIGGGHWSPREIHIDLSQVTDKPIGGYNGFCVREMLPCRWPHTTISNKLLLNKSRCQLHLTYKKQWPSPFAFYFIIDIVYSAFNKYCVFQK